MVGRFCETQDTMTRTKVELVLLRHNPSSVCCWVGTATGTSRQGSDERVNQSHAHGRDRVRNVAFRPQGGILWVDNLWVEQTSGLSRCDEALRGESPPSRSARIRRLRGTSY